MKRLQKLAFISVTLASLLVSNAAAQEAKPNFNQPKCDSKKCDTKKCDGKKSMKKYHKKSRSNSVMRTLSYLDLSKEQRIALRDLRKEQRDARRAYRRANKMQNRRGEAFVNALSKEGLNKEILLAEATKKFQERESRRIDHMAKVIAVLSPEQRVELKKLIQNKMENHKDMAKRGESKK